MADRPVQETINENIIKLLGLENEFEMSYEEYIRHLKEALVSARMTKSAYSTEESELFTEEFKRVKGKKGRFTIKLKKAKVTIQPTQKLLSAGEINKKVNLARFNPSLAIKKAEVTAITRTDNQQYIGRELRGIHEAVDILYREIAESNVLETENAERERKREEDLKRQKKEKDKKKSQKLLVSAVKKFLAPVQSILDKIVRFIVFTLLGRAFNMFMDWAADPKNKDKLQTLGRFLKDWWPVLFGLWFLFANPLGIFIRKITTSIVGLTIRLAKFAIPRLLGFIAENPVAAAAIGTGVALTTATIIGTQQRKEKEEQLFPEKDKKGKPIQKTKEQRVSEVQKKGMIQIGDPMGAGPIGGTFSRGGIISKLYTGGNVGLPAGAIIGNSAFYSTGTPSIPSGQSPGIYGSTDSGWYSGYKSGGVFAGRVSKDTGTTVSGAGPDTQFLPMMGGGGVVLQKGESVLQVGARERMIKQTGIDPLAFNIGSNANKPRTISTNVLGRSFGGILGYAGGGAIGTAADVIKKDEALSSLTPGKNDYIKPGGRSIVSNIDWSKITPSTPIYAYSTGVSGDRPTIGWGATYYDGLLNGTKPVKPGDVITKSKADEILNNNIAELASTYSKKIPSWNKLNSNQQAGILSIGYNAPAGPIGAYPKLTSALKIGDMKEVARQAQRSGPNADRIKKEQSLLLDTSKPKLTTTPIVPKAKPTPKSQPNIFQNVGNFVSGLFGNPAYGDTPKKKEKGGLIGENTGENIPGATADRQMINVAVQPGEYKYIFTKRAVDRGAVDVAEYIQAKLDPNSDAARKGKYNIEPSVRKGRGGMVTLPPITQNSGGVSPVAPAPASGSVVPAFSVVSTSAIETRMQNAERYGIV